MRRAVLACWLVLAILLTGSPAAADTMDTAEKWADALAAGTPDRAERALRYVAPGSPAEARTKFSIELARARQLTGISDLVETDVRRSGKTLRTCAASAVAEDDCVTLSGFRANRRGRLTSYRVDGQRIAASDVVFGDDATVGSAIGITARLVAARYQGSDDLSVFIVAVTNERSGPAFVFPEAYIGSDGVQRSPQGEAGPRGELRPGATGTWLVSVSGAGLGGTLSMRVSASEPFESGTITLPVPVGSV